MNKKIKILSIYNWKDFFMAKKILKIVYLAFALIMAFLVYIIGYNSNGYSHIQKLTADALNDKNYVDIAQSLVANFV